MTTRKRNFKCFLSINKRWQDMNASMNERMTRMNKKKKKSQKALTRNEIFDLMSDQCGNAEKNRQTYSIAISSTCKSSWFSMRFRTFHKCQSIRLDNIFFLCLCLFVSVARQSDKCQEFWTESFCEFFTEKKIVMIFYPIKSDLFA